MARVELVGNEELIVAHLLNRPSAIEFLGDGVCGADGVLSGWHVDIDDLHGEPRHKDEEGDHGAARLLHGGVDAEQI